MDKAVETMEVVGIKVQEAVLKVVGAVQPISPIITRQVMVLIMDMRVVVKEVDPVNQAKARVVAQAALIQRIKAQRKTNQRMA